MVADEIRHVGPRLQASGQPLPPTRKALPLLKSSRSFEALPLQGPCIRTPLRGSRGGGSPEDYYRKGGLLETISMVFEGFRGDPPVILQGDPPPP